MLTVEDKYASKLTSEELAMWNRLYYLIYIAGYKKHVINGAFGLTPRKFLLNERGSNAYNECTVTLRKVIDALTQGLEHGDYPTSYSSDDEATIQFAQTINKYIGS